MANKNTSASALIRPTLGLTGICTVVTLLLALTNWLTAGRIAQNAVRKAAESRQKVLAAADYQPVDSEGRICKAFDDKGRLIGMVVTTASNGYGGATVQRIRRRRKLRGDQGRRRNRRGFGSDHFLPRRDGRRERSGRHRAVLSEGV